LAPKGYLLRWLTAGNRPQSRRVQTMGTKLSPSQGRMVFPLYSFGQVAPVTSTIVAMISAAARREKFEKA
jgi:hypothetical protein